jgi:hypothetical protein
MRPGEIVCAQCSSNEVEDEMHVITMLQILCEKVIIFWNYLDNLKWYFPQFSVTPWSGHVMAAYPGIDTPVQGTMVFGLIRQTLFLSSNEPADCYSQHFACSLADLNPLIERSMIVIQAC